MSDQENEKYNFTGWKKTFFPIHTDELKKFLPMAFIMFGILFNYTIMRDLKDALLNADKLSGPEVLSFVKSWLVMPSAIVFVLIFTKLSNMFSREKIFYIIITFFLSFFAIFAFILYPNVSFLHPTPDKIIALQETYPLLKYIFPIYGLWTYTLFYICSELWGSVMIALLFWQFANEVIRTREAKRFFPLFGLIANLGLIFSGSFLIFFAHEDFVSAYGFLTTMQICCSAIVLFGLASMFIYRWMNKVVLTDPKYYEVKLQKKKNKTKLSVVESFKYLFSSPYLACIAILVMSYGMTIFLCEFIWKKQVQEWCHYDQAVYTNFMGKFSLGTGVATILVILFCKNIIRKFGWLTGAIITPSVMLITGISFYLLMLNIGYFETVFLNMGVSILTVSVVWGAAQNILTKSSKYALFDPTKEMSYIPLDAELRSKGKAAVDVIGGRLGKAAGSYIVQILILVTTWISGVASDAHTITPYLAVILITLVIFWLLAVFALNKRYKQQLKIHRESL